MKNYLNKVILINSAGIPYREILLNGNIHFIGTQGTGKSTVQRAILYFYTADSKRSKLGIKTSQKSFIDFYFPFENSYIVYEIQKEHTNFFVYVYKRSNSLKYVFVDGAYDKNLFWEETVAFGRRELAHNISLSKRFHSKVVDTKEEYKNIIYGNNRQFRNFALMRSNAYENIPRTIANIFLNSGLDSNVIKKTMIASIADSPKDIELVSHEKHLRDFKEAFDQLSTMGNNLPFAGRIINNYKQLKADRKIAYELAQNIVNAAYGTKKALKKEQEATDLIKKEIEERKSELEIHFEQFKAKYQQLTSQKAIIEDFLKKLEEKKDKYRKINIEELLKEYQNENQYNSKKSTLNAEKDIITANFKELEQKYNARKAQAENTFISGKNRINQDYNFQFQQIQKEEGSLKDENSKEIEVFTEEHTINIDKLNKESDSLKDQVYNTQLQLEKLKHKPFYKEELIENESSLNQSKNELNEIEKEQADLLQEIKKLEANLKLDERERELEVNKIENKYKHEKAKIEEELKKLQTKISSFEGTFYDYLNKNEPDWHQTFGKICSEQLIFSDETYFKKEEESRQSVLGYNFELDNLQNQFAKPEQYIIQEKNLAEKRAEIITKWEQEQAVLIDKFEKKKAEQNRKIKKYKLKIDELNYKKETLNKKLELLKREFLSLEEKIEKERAIEKQLINEKTDALNTSLEKKEKEKSALRSAFVKTKFHKMSTLREELEVIKKETSGIEQNKNTKIATIESDYNTELKKIDDEKRKELSGTDLDTEKLELIESELEHINTKLKLIDENKQYVHEYLSDKKEYFNQELKEAKTLEKINEKLIEEEAKNKLYQDKKKAKIESKEKLVQEKQVLIADWAKEIKYYTDYTKSSLFYDYKEFLKEIPKPSNFRQINELIGSLREQHDKNRVSEERLFTNVSSFCGKFTLDNLFAFPTQFESNQQKEEFIEHLKDYIETNRLETHRKEAQKKYSLMTARISNEYEELYKYRRDIEKIVLKINQAFRGGEIFVGAVKNIELRVSESNHSVIKSMKSIKEFSDENSHLQGEVNLFNASDEETANIKATQLLTDFYESVTSYRHENIYVEDSFDIQLRVIENDNDTGWLEKLSNVGSNGTEILVKAMINIMLLHVFIENATKRDQKEVFNLHCIIDEVGVLHDSNVRGLSDFANRKGIWLINGSPNANDANSYTHIYKFQKIADSKTKIVKLLTNIELDNVPQT